MGINCTLFWRDSNTDEWNFYKGFDAHNSFEQQAASHLADTFEESDIEDDCWMRMDIQT